MAVNKTTNLPNHYSWALFLTEIQQKITHNEYELGLDVIVRVYISII
jgi:hypothetical protein